MAKGRRVMVFCNTLDSCRAADHFLQERGLPTLCYHGDVPLDGRREAIRTFSEADSQDDVPVLVCTDLAARYYCFSDNNTPLHRLSLADNA